MDVTIGIAAHGQQVTLSVDEKPEVVEKRVLEALDASALTLVDNKGKRVIVPTDKLAFVEIGVPDGRRVGFSTVK